MKFLNSFLSFSVFLGFFFSSPTLVAADKKAQIKTQAKVQTPTVPKWKASVDSFYYDLKGRHPADGNIYGFEGVTYAVQAMTMTYQAAPLLSFSVIAKHVRKYAETRFLGVLYKDRTKGLADTIVKGTKTFIDSSGLYTVDLGLSLPTGSYQEKNVLVPNINYPYNMQLGTGTFDWMPSLVYLKILGKHQIGGLGMATLRTGRNSLNYRMGNEYTAKAWYNYQLSPYISPGVWLNYHHIQRLTGEDPTFGRNQFVEFYHTPRHFWDLSLNMNFQYSFNKTFKARGQLGRPLWQESKNIDNVQVYTQWFAQLGVEAAF